MKTLGLAKSALPLLATLALLVAPVRLVLAHEGKDTEDGKYRVSFGGTPEPVITEAPIRLEFRINLKADDSLVSGVKDAQAVIIQDGKTLTTLAAPESPASRRGKGWYDTDVFIITQPGKYIANVSFTDPAGKKYMVKYDWEVKDRSALYLTGPTQAETAIQKLKGGVEHVDKAADSAVDTTKSLDTRIAKLEQQAGTLKVQDASDASSSHAPGWASPVAILGLVAGILALVGTGFAFTGATRRR